MRSGQKVAISILSSVLFFAAFTLAAFLGLFSAVESRFYRPALVADIHSGLADAADTLDLYLDDLKNRFYTDFVQNDHVRQSFSFEQSSENIKGREDAAGTLFADTPALTAIRVIDADGKKIHYSTLLSDILRQNEQLISYKLYKDASELPYERVISEEGESGKLIFDPERDRILYSFPFYDSYSAYRGTIIFYTAVSDFARELVRLNSASITDTLLFTGTEETPLLVLSFPSAGRVLLQDILIKRARGKNIGTAEKIIASDDSHDKLLFSHLSRSGIYVVRIYEESLFLFSDALKLLLLVSVLITSFLIIFLIFNIKQDDMLVIRDKIRRFQFAVIHDYLKRKEEVDWNAVCADMKRRKQEINIGIKKSLGKKARRHVHEVDYLLDKNWDEIIAVLQNQNAPAGKNKAQSAAAELKLLMEELAKRPDLISAVRNAAAVQTDMQKSGSSAGSTEALEEVEAVEDIEALEEVSDAEPAEALEEVEGVEDVEALEEVSDAEPAEVLEEVEGVEDIEALEEVSDAEPAEALEEVEAVEEAEVLEEVEAVEEAEALEEAEAVEEAEVLEEAEAVEEAEVLEEAELLEEVKPSAESASVSGQEAGSAEAAVYDPDDPFYEELRIGEMSSTKAHTAESPDPEIKDIFSGIEIGRPDFSLLDESSVAQQKVSFSDSDVDVILSDIEMGLPDFSSLDAASDDTGITVEPVEDIIEAEEVGMIANLPFSFTLGKYASVPKTVSGFSDSILEKDGLFVVSAEAGSEIKDSTLDKEFKTLVKSVLK